MIYDYECDMCGGKFEVIKPMSECATEELCKKCNITARRVWSSKVELHNTKVKDAEYYHSLGVVVKNDRHRKELIKRHGLVEVGNESSKSIKYHSEKHRLAKLARDYEE